MCPSAHWAQAPDFLGGSVNAHREVGRRDSGHGGMEIKGHVGTLAASFPPSGHSHSEMLTTPSPSSPGRRGGEPECSHSGRSHGWRGSTLASTCPKSTSLGPGRSWDSNRQQKLLAWGGQKTMFPFTRLLGLVAFYRCGPKQALMGIQGALWTGTAMVAIVERTHHHLCLLVLQLA